MAHKFDATLKDILSPSLDGLVVVFALTPLKPAATLNVDLSTITAATDLVIGFGEPIQEIADLNFQSGPDPQVDARCLLYSAALRHRFHVPVRTLVILLRPKADSPRLSGILTYQSGNTRVEFVYEVIRMWEQPVELFLHGQIELIPLATLCALPDDISPAEAMRKIIHEIDKRLSTECDHAVGMRLMTAAHVLVGLRIPRKKLDFVFEGVNVMFTEPAAIDEYMEEGAIRGSQRTILRQARHRLGPPSEENIAELKAIQDADRLDRLADAVLIASSWQELLATP